MIRKNRKAALFHLSPYRIYSPTRINSRIEAINFATRPVDPRDITIIEWPPVTRPERALVSRMRESGIRFMDRPISNDVVHGECGRELAARYGDGREERPFVQSAQSM